VVLEEAAARSFERRLQHRIDAYRLRAARGEVRRDAEVLAALTALRQIGSAFKLAAAARLIEALRAEGESVVVFTAFVASARGLHHRFGGDGGALLLEGAVPIRRRAPLVEAFQRGARPLLIATFGTAGLGFTLHRARHVLLLDRPWTPGDAEQAEDRCHRIGMGSSLTSHWLQLGITDQFIDDLIAGKAERISQLLHHPAPQGRRSALVELGRQWLDQWGRD
jgi:SNF2 family DNA or RNA helicase